jgi:hypothetical protein
MLPAMSRFLRIYFLAAMLAWPAAVQAGDNIWTASGHTTDRTVRDLMASRGWLIEGDGPDSVVMCAPQ